MKKALLALLLFSAFMFVLPAASDAAIQQDTDGYYLLATSSDLKEFKELVDSGYLIAKGKLTNDIVLSSDQAPCDWTDVGPIGPSSSREFLGVLDGQGYAIKGLYLEGKSSNTALVGILGAAGVIKNLTVSGHIKSTNSSTGAFAGTCHGSIINCVNNAEITTSASLVGGIAGSVDKNDDDDTISIINCLNTGKITADGGAVAGIAGSLGAGCKLENCVNTGDVNSTSSTGIGGIVGNMNDDSAVANCVNTGDVAASTPSSKWGGANNVGGITGSASRNTTITNCVSTGNVTATPHPDDTSGRTGTYIGGILGKATGENTVNCSWFKDSTISPNHGIGGTGSYDAGSDEGTTSFDKKEKLPVSAILLDSYVKTGHTFELTATAYPAESEQAAALAVTAAEGLELTPAALKSGEETTLTVAAGTAGTEYKAEVSAGDASAAFTVIPADAPQPPSGSSSGGCSAGFGALALLALLPLALRRRG